MPRPLLIPIQSLLNIAAFAIGLLTVSSRVQELDSLLRARVFVNPHRVVTQGVRASVESYSIKALEELYRFTRTTALADARRARDLFERALEEGQPDAIANETRSHVAGYNCDDCVSTLHVRDWLERLRTEFESSNGLDLPRPAPASNEVSQTEVAWNERAKPIAAQLLAGLPEDPAEHSEEQKARWLLADLLRFHEREQKPVWWDYNRLAEIFADASKKLTRWVKSNRDLGPVLSQQMPVRNSDPRV